MKFDQAERYWNAVLTERVTRTRVRKFVTPFRKCKCQVYQDIIKDYHKKLVFELHSGKDIEGVPNDLVKFYHNGTFKYNEKYPPRYVIKILQKYHAKQGFFWKWAIYGSFLGKKQYLK